MKFFKVNWKKVISFKLFCKRNFTLFKYFQSECNQNEILKSRLKKSYFEKMLTFKKLIIWKLSKACQNKELRLVFSTINVRSSEIENN